jgi:CDP-4-dehydro-6-deoxyglucose reductase, E3
MEFILPDDCSRYSIRTRRTAGRRVEPHVRRMPGCKFTDHVLYDDEAKEILRVGGPFGSFYVRDDSDKPMVAS